MFLDPYLIDLPTRLTKASIMKKDDTENKMDTDSLEELLSGVTPRAKPRAEAEDKAFKALETQWRDLTARRDRRSRMTSWSIAASVVLAVVLGYNWLGNSEPIVLDPVANVARASGDLIYANGVTIDGTSGESPPFSVGDTLTTGSNSRISLRWYSGGSLRVDQNTEVTFTSAETVQLVSGTLYFDSLTYDRTDDESPALSIDTVAGRISHVGTQFFTSVVDSEVAIGVREGQVLIDGPKFNFLAEPKDNLRINVKGLLSRHYIEPFDATWRWAEDIAPRFNPDGRTAQEMVTWVGRETGRHLRFQSEEVERNAFATSLVGLDNLSPMQALRTIQFATDLRYDIIDEEIVIRLSEERP